MNGPGDQQPSATGHILTRQTRAHALGKLVTTATSAPVERDRQISVDHIMPEQTNFTALPPRQVFSIQVGDKLFSLSGASIASDSPSYFSYFFEDPVRSNPILNESRPLYIDRDPSTFEDIVLHLQGYHIEPRDSLHFIRLLADAQFFSLPRLTAQLFCSQIFIHVGGSEFRLTRELFNKPGNSPNYFSLNFPSLFTPASYSTANSDQPAFPQAPSIVPLSVPNRSARTFADLLHILKGYPIHIRDEEHRAELLQDARYYHLKGLEQRLLPHEITYCLARQRTQILIRLEDIRQSGISYVSDNAVSHSTTSSPASNSSPSGQSGPGWIFYQRPYVDTEAHSLVVEVGGEESCTLSIVPSSQADPVKLGRAAMYGRATFYGAAQSRMTRLLAVVAKRINPSSFPSFNALLERGSGATSASASPDSFNVGEERVKVRVAFDADVVVNGRRWLGNHKREDDHEEIMEANLPRATRQTPKGNAVEHNVHEGLELVVKRSQWRIRVQPTSGDTQSGKGRIEVVLGAVKIDGYSNDRARNTSRAFLNKS